MDEEVDIVMKTYRPMVISIVAKVELPGFPRISQDMPVGIMSKGKVPPIASK